MQGMTTTEIFTTMVDWIVDNTEMRNPTEALRKAGLNTANYSKIKSGTNKAVKYETMRKLNDAFGKPFNPEWMRGRSDKMLMADVAPLCSVKQNEPADAVASLLAAKDDIIAEKSARIADLRQQVSDLRQQVADFRQQVADLRAQLNIEKGRLSTGRSRSESAEQHPAL